MLGSLFGKAEERSVSPISLADYQQMFENFSFNGIGYTVPAGKMEELTALRAMRNPIVGACISQRLMVFSEIRFALQHVVDGRGTDFRYDTSLRILDEPWPQASTGDLLARMEMDVSLYGNSYWIRNAQFNQLVRLSPPKVTILSTDVLDMSSGKPIGKRVIGYGVCDDKGVPVATLLPEEVCHYRILPDPNCEGRGITWLNSLLPDIEADDGLTNYKGSFIRNAATPNLVMSAKDGISQENFSKFRDKMESRHTGINSGFKTLYLSAGVDVKVVGSNFADLAMNAVQSAGETRIAAAARVPASLVGLAEGLKGSALNAGNYTATRRSFADGTMRPLWRKAASALSTLVPVARGSRLWYDARDVAFLQEDVTDDAAIKQQDAATISSYISAGFTPESAVDAVVSGDLSRLDHTGLVSVQLQKPGPALPAGGATQPDPRLPGTEPPPQPVPIPGPEPAGAQP